MIAKEIMARMTARFQQIGENLVPRYVASNDRRLIVVSNRVAVEGPKPDTGGLAIALRAALEGSGGIWFGWSGRVTNNAVGEPETIAQGSLTCATLDLSQRDFDEYYLGFANRVLWPLFHLRTGLVGYSRHDFAGYLRVNRMFARALTPMLLPRDLVWVHDYHLIPLARELRQLDQGQQLGFFLHTPFPPAELFRVLPNHRDLAEALCAYDLVGFQTKSDLHGFCDYLLRWAGLKISAVACSGPSGASCARMFFRSASMSQLSLRRQRQPTAAATCVACGKASTTE